VRLHAHIKQQNRDRNISSLELLLVCWAVVGRGTYDEVVVGSTLSRIVIKTFQTNCEPSRVFC